MNLKWCDYLSVIACLAEPTDLCASSISVITGHTVAALLEKPEQNFLLEDTAWIVWKITHIITILSDQQTISSVCQSFNCLPSYFYFCLLHCWAPCGESVSENLIVKGKLRWKEPFKRKTVTVTCLVAITQFSWCKTTGIPLDGQHDIRSLWEVSRLAGTVSAVSAQMNSTETRGWGSPCFKGEALIMEFLKI